MDINNELIFIPINVHNNHWIFIEINTRLNTIYYVNSMHSSEKEASKFFHIIKAFLALLEKENGLDNAMWNSRIADSPKQENMNDCGVFMLKGIHYRLRNYSKMFKQTDIPYFRMLITNELLLGKLLSQPF